MTTDDKIAEAFAKVRGFIYRPDPANNYHADSALNLIIADRARIILWILSIRLTATGGR